MRLSVVERRPLLAGFPCPTDKWKSSMTPRFLRLAAIGAIFLALIASASPDRRAAISLDLHDARDVAPRHFDAELDLGIVALSLRLRWSARA
jgi:hypothetical protein